MISIKYNKEDLRFIFVGGDAKDISALEKYLNKIPDYMFMPSFSGVPKPEVFLNKYKSKTGQIVHYCHAGLYKTIYDWCIRNAVACTGIDPFLKYTEFNMTVEEFGEWVNGLGLSLDPRGYQIKAAWLILKYRCSLSQLCTRSGKTLIMYIVSRYMLEHGANNILIVVPSIQLVKQGVDDFQEYQEFFTTETVWAKGEYCEESNMTIGTYQSLVKRADVRSKTYNPKWFNKFDVVIVDEAHHLKCKSIDTIMKLPFMKNVKLRFGFSGTLPEEGTIDSFCAHSLMGPTIQDLTSAELIEQGILAKPDITQVRINYPLTPELIDEYIRCGEYLCGNYKLDDDGKKILLPKDERDFTMQHVKVLPYAVAQVKKTYDKKDYMDYLVSLCKAQGSNALLLEQMIVHRSNIRMAAMFNILRGLDKNCIVFAHHTTYIKHMYDYFSSAFPDKQVYMIDARTSLKKREEIIRIMNENNDVILVASYGCVSTGLTFKNVDYAIFAQSFKSSIVNLQSIGRGLLKTDEKDTFYIYDLIDCLPTQRLFLQGVAKIKIYKQQKFTYRIEQM